MVCTVLAEDGLNEETREKMVEAVEKSMQSLGEPSFEDGMKKAAKVLQAFADRVRSIQTLDEFRTILDGYKSSSKAEEGMLLLAARYLPALARVFLKLLAKRASADLPAPPGGRHPSLTAQRAKEAVDYVSTLHHKGASMDAAKRRAGQRCEVSRRTIDRTWANRASIPEEAPTMAQVIEEITQGL
jgi:hypothetical protein